MPKDATVAEGMNGASIGIGGTKCGNLTITAADAGLWATVTCK
jgi:hypothetical protein